MSFLDRLGPRWRARLMELGTERHLARGELLLRRGDPRGDIYLVESGGLEAVDPRLDPPRITATLEPGQVVGALSFIDRTPRTLDVRARVDSRIRVWERRKLRTSLAADPAFGAAVFEALAQVVATRLRVVDALVSTRSPSPAAPGEHPADPVVGELCGSFREAWASADTDRFDAFLRATAEALEPLAGTERADEVASAITSRVGARLELARTAELFLQRSQGTPATPALWRHLEEGRPAGGTDTAVHLDQTLLALPTLAAVAWRRQQHRTLLGELRISAGDRVGLLAPAHPLLAEDLGRLLAGRCGHLLLLGQDPQGLADPKALVALGTGVVPPDLPPLRALVVDGLTDQLPDRLLGGLLRVARQLLQPRARLLLGLTRPAWDTPLVDHLLRWPLLARQPEHVGPLHEGSQAFRLLEAHRSPADAGAIVVARRRSGA